MFSKVCTFVSSLRNIKTLCKRKSKSPEKRSSTIGQPLYESDFTTGDDESEFELPFSMLDAEQRRNRCEFLWHSAYLRAHGGGIILRKFSEVHRNLLIFGTTKNINFDPNENERYAYKRRARLIILPESRLMRSWNIIIMLLLIYTATFLPLRTAFMDVDPPGLFESELFIDALFFCDVYMNFVTAYVDKNTGFIEVSFKKIAYNYMTTWFLLDITACIPF